MQSLHFSYGRPLAGLATALLLCLTAAGASAQTDQIYFPAVDNVTNVLVQKINAETVRIDMSAWYLTEHAVSIALLSRFQAGVTVRLIGDRGSIFEIDPKTKTEFEWLASYGVPIRLRYNPTWYPEIDHWKCSIFVGQNLVEFGSANYTPFQLAPSSSTNYDDETALFTTDSTLVGAFKTKFDQIWNDTTNEPESVYGGPPYFKNWNDACALESACADYWTTYPSPVPMVVNTARLEPDRSMPADLIWGQGPDFNNRVVTEINSEGTRVDFVIYRLTVDNVTQALMTKFQAGVPVRLIIEPNEYLNRKWPEFWLTHANLDKLWAAGVSIKQRQHQGITHMKTLITSNYATNGSSNFSAGWERDQNYFVSASGKPTIYAALVNRFQTMWGDTSGFTDFVPQPPDAASLAAPASGATGVSTTPTLTWNRAAFAVSYDVYLGTSSSSLSWAGNVAAQLVNNPPTTYSWSPSSALATGTTYFWQIVSRTNATPKNASLVASSPVASFTTGGTGGGGGSPLPAPWQDQDVGSVGVAGSASYTSGQFTVNGAGSDIWGTSDSFNYAYQGLSGDGQIVARVTGIQNTNSFAKAGVMFRDSASSSAASVILDVRPGGAIEFMTRSSNGGSTAYLGGATQAPPAWLRLARTGSTFTASVSSDGSSWTVVGTTTASLSSSALVGLAVTSHTTGATAAGTFDNVAIGAVSGGGGGGGGSTLPAPWQGADVGSTGIAGSASYASGQFTVTGAGADIWGNSDSFQYVYQPLPGDGQIVARVTSLQNTSSFAKAGVMLRETLASGAADVILDARPGGPVEFMSRPSTNAATNYLAGATQAMPTWLRLTRSGSTVTGEVSADGTSWTTVGTTSVSMATSIFVGLAVTSHTTSAAATATFDNVAVTAGGSGPPPPTPDVVIYASDVPSSGLHGSWTPAGDGGSPNGVKLATPDNGTSFPNAPLASPADYVDVTFNAVAGTPYRVWLRMQALNNNKYNDSVWVQFTDTGSYGIGSTSGLLVNLATDGTGASLSGWGWQNTAYWLSQQTTVTFSTTGSHTIRIQVREDGAQFDQIVLSPTRYFSAAPGPASNDTTIVTKQ
jgi:regulation of enolase protein 1 (concanavalin A-like superfamily)/phosphatidylserine/phosphatidylglycerophosphate/cardiolipin synthase-like enzyme